MIGMSGLYSNNIILPMHCKAAFLRMDQFYFKSWHLEVRDME